MKAIITVGIPASGKSTKYTHFKGVIVNRDDARELLFGNYISGEYKFSSANEKKVTEYCWNNILEAKELNIALAQEGLDNPYGLEVGRTYQKNIETGLLSKSLDSDILIYTSAASDARMGGATLPAMSNYGSGNQGIAATIPVVKMADFYNADEEALARAFIMSHLGAIYIKSHYPPLSAFCGNAVTSAAAAMAMVS